MSDKFKLIDLKNGGVCVEAEGYMQMDYLTDLPTGDSASFLYLSPADFYELAHKMWAKAEAMGLRSLVG